MGTHMKRRSRRKSRKSRKRRGGKIPKICKMKNIYGPMKDECKKMEAKAKEIKAMASEAAAEAPTKDLKKKFQGVARKVGKQALVVKKMKDDVAATEKAVKGAAPELKAKLEKQFRAMGRMDGGKRKRRTKRRRKSRKSKKSRRKSRKTKRRRKSKRRRSRKRRR